MSKYQHLQKLVLHQLLKCMMLKNYDLGVVITSSPDVIFKARKEASSASVALQTPMLYLFPI